MDFLNYFMKNMFRGLLLVSGGMVAGALISASLAGPAKQGASILPLDEIRQFTDVYGAVKQFYVEPVEDKKLMKELLRLGVPVGLMNSVINIILLLFANKVAKTVSDTSLL